ncbi:MAG: hypothetical protein WAW41_00935 [Methylobacter sp.]
MANTRKKVILSAAFLCLAGCAGVKDLLTPSLSEIKDPFDGSIIASQPPVCAASSLLEDWHTLGFEWNKKYPDVVFIDIGEDGIINVKSVAFNVDGQIIENIRVASPFAKYGSWANRRLVLPISDFVKIAQGNHVKMKINQIDTYSFSSFGNSHPGAVVSEKFPPFLQYLKANNAIPN